jgi:ribosomal protein S4
MIPKLNWNRKNIGKLILFHEFNQIFKPKKKIKNNQFNIKWFFNRFLFLYYQRNHLSFAEGRLDLLLFRTNWFKSYYHLKKALVTGKVLINGKKVKNGKILMKKGDICRIVEGGFPNYKNITPRLQSNPGHPENQKSNSERSSLNQSATQTYFDLWKKKEIKYSLRFSSFHHPYNTLPLYLDWLKTKWMFLLKNPVYLEINNNIKTFILLTNPEYKNIPYPRNLNKLYKDEN